MVTLIRAVSHPRRQKCYVSRVEEHTRALKMEGTREHFNEHVHVANTAVYNIYISYYISASRCLDLVV